MKTFVYSSVLFLSISILGFVLSIAAIEKLNVNRLWEYLKENDFDTLVIGDSHIQKSINDSLLISTINLSQTSENFYYSYYKILKLIQPNHTIRKIYLGLNYHSLSSYYDEFVFGQYSNTTIPNYFFILPHAEKIDLLVKNYRRLSVILRDVYWLGIRNLFYSNDKISFLGHYENEFTNVSALKNSMEKRLILQFYIDKQVRPFSEINMNYLHKIINICEENNIELIMLKTPVHQYYKKNIPIEYIEKLDEIFQSNSFKLIDLNDTSFPDIYFIPDGDHVSYIGSIATTKQFRVLNN